MARPTYKPNRVPAAPPPNAKGPLLLIDQTFTVTAPADVTAAFFSDIERVSGCIPGVQDVCQAPDGTYEATLGVRLGPIRAAFGGVLALDDSEAPKRLRATGEGRDRATGSSAKVEFTADLSEDEPGKTTVRAVADVAIRGKLSQFGTGVMRAAAGEIVREFAACADATLAADGHTTTSDDTVRSPVVPTAPRGAATPSGGHAQRGLVTVVLRGVVRRGVALLRRAADRLERRLDRREHVR